MKSQNIIVGALSVLMIAMVFIAFLLSQSLRQDGASQKTKAEKQSFLYLPESTIASAQESVQKSSQPSETIAIPGYETIRMKAGVRDQVIQLYNPEENACYFLISIILPDGKEICRTEMIAPGTATSSVCLYSPLEAGIYKDAALVYSCFSMDDVHQLNGATVKFTLEVQT